MEVQEMKLQEVVERLSQLDVEVREASDVGAIEKAESLRGELMARKGELEQLEERRQAYRSLNGSVPQSGFAPNNAPVAQDNEMVHRNAFLKHLRGLPMNDLEQRAMTTASSSAGAVVPTLIATEVIKKVKEYAPLLDKITLLQVAGSVTFAVEGTKTTAGIHTQGATITADSDTLVPVTLSGYEITKLITISKSVSTMAMSQFEQWLTDMIAQGISEKISALIIAGTGTDQPKGIEKANTWGATNSVTVTSSGSLTVANILALIALLPGGYDKNASFLMSKKTFFTDVLPLQDDNSNKFITAENGNYSIYGYPVDMDETVALHDAYLGDLKKVVGNLASDISITSGFDTKTNSFDFLGDAIFDCKPAIGEAFVKLTKAST